MAPTEAQIREALTRVIDPELKQDLVSLDMIKSVVIDGGDVTVGVTLTIPGCPLKATITDDVTREVGAVAGVAGFSHGGFLSGEAGAVCGRGTRAGPGGCTLPFQAGRLSRKAATAGVEADREAKAAAFSAEGAVAGASSPLMPSALV